MTPKPIKKPSLSSTTATTTTTKTATAAVDIPSSKESSHLFSSDIKEKVTDMNEFIQTQESNQIGLHLKNLNHLNDHVTYKTSSLKDEYSTLASSTSSSLSLQDALFSHFSNLDTRSEISSYSSNYNSKIIVRAQQQSPSVSDYDETESLFDRRFSITDTSSSSSLSDLFNTLVIQKEDDALYYQREFCNMYVDGLRFLSTSSPEQSPARAYTLFEFISIKGHQFYSNLNQGTKRLVSFAQYRAGRMLYECSCNDDDDTMTKKQGLLYLQRSAKNGNARASFILGLYAEQIDDVNLACQYYHHAAAADVLPAKVSFGTAVLFRGASNFKANEAINLLEEASSEGHSIASLSLALYYEKIDRLDLSIKYCNLVQISPQSPIYCISSYQIGVIYLKAGPNFAATAHRYILAAAEATYYQDGGGQETAKFTTPLRKLGILHLKGIGTPRNQGAAFKYILEAAKLGDEPANILLGQMYWNGQGVEANLSVAMKIFANYGDNIAATLSRGLLIMKENPTHAYQEFQNVVHHCTTPFDEEHWDVASIKNEARVRIAVWEYNGIGGAEKNPSRAFATLKKLSDDYNYSGAHYWLAWAYMDGVKLEDGTVVVPVDIDQGFLYFLKGAIQDVHECQYRVGLMLREDYKHPKLIKKDAFDFFYAAAKKDNVDALTMVGVYYYTGSVGEGRDLDRAFEFFSAAAKYNDPLAIQYLADYIIKNKSSNSIDHRHVFNELNRSAGTKRDPTAFRMLALVAEKSVDPRNFYEKGVNPQSDYIDENLLNLYHQAKQESLETNTDLKFRFALHCLWQAIKLNDHPSGHLLCKYIPKMSEDDISKSIDIFGQKEFSVATKMSMAFALFLKETGDKTSALKLYIKVAASSDEVTSNTVWSSRIEVAKLILNEGQGKATSKTKVFQWLNEMISYHGKNLFMAFILLGKCHENEICDGCNKELATQYYEYGLECESNDVSMEIYARRRLVETYYKSYDDRKLIEQSNRIEDIIKSITDVSEKKSILADVYYYKGLLALHNGTIYNYREKSRFYLSKSDEYGNILACLELGYLYGTMEGKEELAEECFQKVEASKNTLISFKGRLTESMVLVRADNIRTNNEYLVEINKTKLAAGIMYSYYNMERQSVQWFKEISDNPIAQIMILYYEMKDINKRTPQSIRHLSALLDPFERKMGCDYYDSMAVSYGEFRLGQCYQHGHGVAINNNTAHDLYTKACAYVLNNETYERLAELTNLVGSDTNLFTTLSNSARNDTDATFKLGQYYHARDSNNQDADIPCRRAADYYHEAAQAGHAESCYFYAKYLIAETRKDASINPAVRSKRASNYLRVAANKNHAPSFYELGKLEMEVGLFDEGLEDLEEAAFLNHGLAAYELGELKRTGFTGGISGQVTFKLSQSMTEAMSWYQIAVSNGCTIALIKQGLFYETDELGKQDLAKARACYMEAYLTQKCPEGTAEYALGCLEETCLNLSTAFPTTGQRRIAFDWFHKSLQAKNQNANFKIGAYLLQGWVIRTTAKQDESLGFKILIQEKEEGNVLAIKELARYFEKKCNTEKAFEYWMLACHLDDPEAFEYVAMCFEQGLLGQEVDEEQASRYTSLASDARKQAVETQRSMMGFKSDYSEERNRRSK
ncbi:hypothetical protein EDC94DRAFT_514126 [Helicostylum pulchrum]|nr:hypothetical protein EDC94DRAFT_514126 [Helicostylum pulchrum]